MTSIIDWRENLVDSANKEESDHSTTSNKSEVSRIISKWGFSKTVERIFLDDNAYTLRDMRFWQISSFIYSISEICLL